MTEVERKGANSEQWMGREQGTLGEKCGVPVKKVGGGGIRSMHAELGWGRGAKHQASLRTLKETEHLLH